MASSLAACLQSVGFEMTCVYDVVQLLHRDSVVNVAGLTKRLDVCRMLVVLPCSVLTRLQLAEQCLAHTNSGSSSAILADLDDVLSCLFLACACSAFCSSAY